MNKNYDQLKDPRNAHWFRTMYELTAMGGTLITSNGTYKKEPTGWKKI